MRKGAKADINDVEVPPVTKPTLTLQQYGQLALRGRAEINDESLGEGAIRARYDSFPLRVVAGDDEARLTATVGASHRKVGCLGVGIVHERADRQQHGRCYKPCRSRPTPANVASITRGRPARP